MLADKMKHHKADAWLINTGFLLIKIRVEWRRLWSR
jgi:ATP-dependent phosphoenolpyruvate carboxykinase